VADSHGRVQIVFPYPAPPPRVLTSPPQPAASRWSVGLAAFFAPAPSGVVPATPDLATLLAQFGSPARLLSDFASPPVELAPLELDEGVPLVARGGSLSMPLPFLFLDSV
jgi:hypothetical protein